MLHEKQSNTNDLSGMCTLPGREFAERRQEIQRKLLAGAFSIEELSDGYELCFPGEDAWFSRLVAFITFERNCCPFFTFELIILPNQEGIRLRMRGNAVVKAALKNEFRIMNHETLLQ